MAFSSQDIARMKEIFFNASLQGYASENVKKTKEKGSLAKLIPFEEGKYRVDDRYWVGADGCSGGTMVMFDGYAPVWMMSYFGQYKEEAITPLKTALLANYEQRIFLGGRGPANFCPTEDHVYENEVEAADFRGFKGRERVRQFGTPKGKLLGYHWYHGGLLG